MKILTVLVILLFLFLTYDSISYVLKNFYDPDIFFPVLFYLKSIGFAVSTPIEEVKETPSPFVELWGKDELLCQPLYTALFTLGITLTALLVYLKFSKFTQKWNLNQRNNIRKVEKEIDATEGPNPSPVKSLDCSNDVGVIGIENGMTKINDLTPSKSALKLDETRLDTLSEESLGNSSQHGLPFKIEVKCECNLLSLEDRLRSVEKTIQTLSEAKVELHDSNDKVSLQLAELQRQVDSIMADQTVRLKNKGEKCELPSRVSNMSINSNDLSFLQNISDMVANAEKKFASKERYKMDRGRVESEEEPQREKRSPWAGDSSSSESFRHLTGAVAEHQRTPINMRQKINRYSSSPSTPLTRK